MISGQTSSGRRPAPIKPPARASDVKAMTRQEILLRPCRMLKIVCHRRLRVRLPAAQGGYAGVENGDFELPFQGRSATESPFPSPGTDPATEDPYDCASG